MIGCLATWVSPFFWWFKITKQIIYETDIWHKLFLCAQVHLHVNGTLRKRIFKVIMAARLDQNKSLRRITQHQADGRHAWIAITVDPSKSVGTRIAFSPGSIVVTMLIKM
ncbi:MAG: hypothetical protein H7839_14900 [Magnetococcus sp. YQC-5]